MNESKILRRIEKCLALASSSNPNEAAAALRQARAMMEKHNIDESTIRLNSVDYMSPSDEFFQARKMSRHASWLCSTIAMAFGLRVYLLTEKRIVTQRSGKQVLKAVQVPVFYGMNSDAEIACYTFDVVYRQLLQARKDYSNGLSDRYSAAGKKKLTDFFCEGWVSSVHKVIKEFAGPEDTAKAKVFDEYEKVVIGGLKTSKTRKRYISQEESAARKHGSEKAAGVNIFRATSGSKQAAIGRG